MLSVDILNKYKILNKIKTPKDIKSLSFSELKALASEVRDYIVKVVSHNGGHLASNLGVVDLTIALLYVFDPVVDSFIWDTGHQSYAYKILTDRKEKFLSLRKFEGISGFPNIFESPYDIFGTGHSSTSISASLGIATANEILGEESKVISIIGDGAITSGIAFEGLNNAGILNKDVLVVLNDNEMFISNKVGALGKYFAKILSGEIAKKIDTILENLIRNLRLPENIIKKLFSRIKTIFTPGIIFEELGFNYFGPIDGHDIKVAIDILLKIKDIKGPKLLHIVTKKGKGYKYSEEHPSKFHGVSSFDESNGEIYKKIVRNKTYTEIFSETILEEARKNKKILAITAAMGDGTGLKAFSEEFPDRYFDVGIAESHALVFAASLAKKSLIPICCIYSTFLQRGFDQILHDICLQNLHVIMMIDRSGIVGEDGATHNGIFDISFLRLIPNLIFMSPKDEIELNIMFKSAINYKKPCAIRYPKGETKGLEIDYNSNDIFDLGENEIIVPSGEILVLATGDIVNVVLQTIKKLSEENIKCKFMNIRFIKPLDEDFIREHAKAINTIVTIEENVLFGGFGSMIDEIFSSSGKKIYNIALPDRFIEHGDANIIRDKYDLSFIKIYNKLKDIYLNEK